MFGIFIEPNNNLLKTADMICWYFEDLEAQRKPTRNVLWLETQAHTCATKHRGARRNVSEYAGSTLVFSLKEKARNQK
jgi:hypothetical protein